MGVEKMDEIEDRLKSFTGHLHTESAILDRLVYKHKNQHRRCSYFQYILKVRRDLKLLKSANLEDVLESAFIVLNGDTRPKQKVQLLESLKRRKCNGGKYNFLERLLGVSRLLSQIVEPLLKAATEISTLLARSFFMKFALTILSLLARVRVLVQQMLLDVVHVYNTVSSVSHTEQTVKLNQEGFEVFREYHPRKEKEITVLECVWQMDKYALVEKTHENETASHEKDVQEDAPLIASNILYDNIEVYLGVDQSDTKDETNSSVKVGDGNEGGKGIGDDSRTNVEDGSDVSSMNRDEGGKCGDNEISCSSRLERKRKKVAFVQVKLPTSSTNSKSR